MSEEARDQNQQSDDDFEQPKDEFMFYYKASKLEEKKMINHQKFEEITAKYWQLLRNSKDCDLSKPTISQALYTQLMQRIYKVLLPLYRENEISSEISQEWLMDSRGQQELSFNLLTKLLFRIAHQWAINIDLEEYIDLLNKIYERITYKLIHRGDLNRIDEAYPTIYVQFPLQEKALSEGSQQQQEINKFDDWIECQSNESEHSNYLYEYREDIQNMITKKYKKINQHYNQGEGMSMQGTIIREPVIYIEEVNYSQQPQEGDVVECKLSEMKDIVPFGYPTEQFLRYIKQDVYEQIEVWRQRNKANSNSNKLNFMNLAMNDAQLSDDADNGLLIDLPDIRKFYFRVILEQSTNIEYNAYISNNVYNYLRRQLREGSQMTIRMFNCFPKPGSKSKGRTQLTINEPITETNKFEYNPALDRRLDYKLQSNKTYYNINYLVVNSIYDQAYRADVQKIETKDKLSIKQSEEERKEDDFINVETSYKQLRKIMLSKKFVTIYHERANADIREQKRLKKLIDKEEQRKAQVLQEADISKKNLCETYEEKSLIKNMRGPFYNLQSKQGLLKDDFVKSSEWDLIEEAKTQEMRILVIGKPRSGKTTLCKNLAQRLDLLHINVENWIKALLEKIKNYEPPELEEEQEPPRFLTDLEESIHQCLKEGRDISDEQNISILIQQIYSHQARMKGFILDLPYYKRQESWSNTIKSNHLLPVSKIQNYDQFYEIIDYIIDLQCDDEEVRFRARNMKYNPEDGVTYSRWEREERKKPKPISEDEEEQEEDENAPKPLDEMALIQRTNDTLEQVEEELKYYNSIDRAGFEDLIVTLYQNQYIKVDCAGLTPEEITDQVQCQIKPDDSLPLRSIGQIIEGGSDFKSLLTESIEENQVPRKWSLWKQIDPVALQQGKVIQGLPEFAVSYYNNVFVFSSEDNMKIFLQEPKLYLKNGAPYMPESYRILMLGAKGVGKHTQAQLLSDLFGWRIVDYKQIVKKKLDELIKSEVFIPNNPEGGRIGLSEQELQEMIKKKLVIPQWKFIPWILDYLGYALQKKKPVIQEQKEEEEEEDEETKKKRELEAKKKKIEEEKKRKQEEELMKQREERRRKRQEAIDRGLDLAELGLEDSEEEPVIIEDLPIDQLVLREDENGVKPFVGGFILIGFPETEEHINKLKEHSIEFDRVIYLADASSEEGESEVKNRLQEQSVDIKDYDQELENAQKVLALVKEHIGEELVKEISCNGRQEDVLIRIRNEIDPFYLKVDNPDDNRTSADLGEEDKKLPKGDFGDYCPVTYVKDNWLIRGNPEFEVTVNGKTYWLAGEKEAEEFKFNPSRFLITQNDAVALPLQPPAPKIMIVGVKGAGVTTQINKLCEKYKLESFDLKEQFLLKIRQEKDKRKKQRLIERSKLPPQVNEENEPLQELDLVDEDPEDFDKEKHEREIMKQIFDASKGLIIDGTWTDLKEDSGITQSLQDLLIESRRLPEIVILLKCKLDNSFKRTSDENAIKQEYARLMEIRNEKRKQVREEEREARLKELQQDEEKPQEEIQEEMRQWDEERDRQEKEIDENEDDDPDPERPNLKNMLGEEKTKLEERYQKDEAFLEEFGTAMKDKNVIVIDDIKTDVSADYVFIKILDRVKDNFQKRKDLIEKQLAQPLKPEEVQNFEKSYIYKHSKYGINSPLLQCNPNKTKNHVVLYRERLYFLSNSEEQQTFLQEPSRYTLNNETIPLDIQIKPKIVVVGLPKSGKSTLCKILTNKAKTVHLKMSKIIEHFSDKSRDSIYFENLRKTIKLEGREIDDETMVNLLIKRVQYKDCQQNGWVIEDFPKTKEQAILMSKKGLVPSKVFYVKSSIENCYKRTLDKKDSKFGANRIILAMRINNYLNNLPNVLSFYQKHYNNVSEIDTRKSKWFMEDKALKDVTVYLAARQNFVRDYYLREERGCQIQDMHMDRQLYKQSLSQFKYYCPVSWKNSKLLVKCHENPENSVFYKNAFYFFKTQKERDMFLTNPQRFITNTSFPKDLPLRILPHKAAEIVHFDKVLSNHCSVTVMDEERVVKSDPLLLINYKDEKFTFYSEYKLNRFYCNPFKYSKAQLPAKIPPQSDKISLYNLQKMDDSIIFMEQALGTVVTKALREMCENRLKYPTISVKETMLKLFALYLKTENPANTQYMKKKYQDKMKEFVQKCEIPEELHDLAEEKEKKKPKNKWYEFKENYYNELGSKYDAIIKNVDQEKLDGFTYYIR